MSILIDMKRVSISEAKQTLPALVHEAERRGEIELTRRGKTVAYLVAAEQYDNRPKRTFLEAFEAWREKYGAAVGDEPFDVPRRHPSRKFEIPE